MAEIWIWSIPATIVASSLFHYLIALKFEDDEDTPFRFSLYGFAFLLMLDAVFAIHEIAGDTLNPSQTATFVAYMLCLVSFSWSFIYIIVRAVKAKFKKNIKTGDWWR